MSSPFTQESQRRGEGGGQKRERAKKMKDGFIVEQEGRWEENKSTYTGRNKEMRGGGGRRGCTEVPELSIQ